MRTTFAILGLFLCVQTASAQPRVVIESLMRGTVDEITTGTINANGIDGGSIKCVLHDKCVFIIDGVTAKREDIKRGMKCRIMGQAAIGKRPAIAHEVRCYVNDPLPPPTRPR